MPCVARTLRPALYRIQCGAPVGDHRAAASGEKLPAQAALRYRMIAGEPEDTIR
jgi:hypothetical protein